MDDIAALAPMSLPATCGSRGDGDGDGDGGDGDGG